jgi:hypothetical protein
MTDSELLWSKFPVFNPAWPSEWRKAWLDAFEYLWKMVKRHDSERDKVRSLLPEINSLIIDVPAQLREDVKQEVVLRLLNDGSQSLRPLVRQVRSEVYQSYDLKYRTISLDVPVGDGPETFADRIEG